MGRRPQQQERQQGYSLQRWAACCASSQHRLLQLRSEPLCRRLYGLDVGIELRVDANRGVAEGGGRASGVVFGRFWRLWRQCRRRLRRCGNGH